MGDCSGVVKGNVLKGFYRRELCTRLKAKITRRKLQGLARELCSNRSLYPCKDRSGYGRKATVVRAGIGEAAL